MKDDKLLIPGAPKQKLTMSLHDVPQYMTDTQWDLGQKTFSEKRLKGTVKQVTLACDVVHNNLQAHQIPSWLLHTEGHTWEDWQLDSIQITPQSGFRYLLVFVDTFMGWVWAFALDLKKHLKSISPCKRKNLLCLAFQSPSRVIMGPLL